MEGGVLPGAPVGEKRGDMCDELLDILESLGGEKDDIEPARPK